MARRVFIFPLPGKTVKDLFGKRVPPDGRYYSYGPHWLRAKNKGLVEIREEVKEEIRQTLKKGYYTRKRGAT